MKKFKPRKNLLREFIFNNEMKQASEQTVKSLLRSIVEPVIESNSDGVVLVRLFDTKGLDGLLKRLDYSKAGVYFYSDMGAEIVNVAQDDIWESTEFAIVLAPRYCAALVWDYGASEVEGYTNINFYLNSRIIQDILKLVIDNSRIDFMPDVEPYSLERRQNELMCEALHKVVDCLSEADMETHITAQSISTEIEKPVLTTEVRKIIHEIRNNLSVIDLHSKIIEKRLDKALKTDIESAEKIINAKEIIEKSTRTINLLLDDLKGSTELQQEKLSTKNIKVLGVLLNIINNAIYALKENGKLKVSIEKNTDKTVGVFIENNGEAIPYTLQKQIFEEGFTTKHKDGGSGLGLQISRTSMQLMGGDLILVKSDDDSTVFEMILNQAEEGEEV